MSAPKFQVSEVVIFNCPDWPEHYRQEYTVVAVLRGGDTYAGAPNDWPVDEFGYDLGFTVPESIKKDFTIWEESVLLKRHTPGEMSFLDLMVSLSTPSLESSEVRHA